MSLPNANEKPETSARQLKKSVAELKKANKEILEQQKAVIEEERLKVLLQMAGATAHELNQPLMALLGHIELMEMSKHNPKKMARNVVRIEEAGQRIADIVKRIETIRHVETRPYLDDTSIINLEQKVNILSVEGSDGDFEMINRILKDHTEIALSRANSVREAMQVLQQGGYDLILLDYFLPDGNGLDFLRRMERKGFEIPVAVITGRGAERIASKVVQAGAYDYLPKEMVTEKSLSRVISNSLEKSRLRREIDESQKKIAQMSIKDELTGLYSRRYFIEALEREVSRAKRYETDMVLCMMDLDYFKRINDTYGHLAGDMVLCEISTMLKAYIRQSDLACRYGGEEFAVILPNTQPEEAHGVCERFRQMVSQHQFTYNSYLLRTTISIGIASFNPSNPQISLDLIVGADNALYQAKEAGRNKVVELS